MKTEMGMLDNGTIGIIVSPIQHKCSFSKNGEWTCIEFRCQIGKLILQIEDGDAYDDGYCSSIEVVCCPFCGYKPNKDKEYG